MLSDFRFVIGAILATAMLGMNSLGLYATVKLRHQTIAGPIESSRNPVFDDRADWNQFYYPDSARRFEELLARGASASEPAGGRPWVAPAGETEPREHDPASDAILPPASTSPGAAPDDPVASAMPVVTNEIAALAPRSIDLRPEEPAAAQAATKDASPAGQPSEARAVAAAAAAIESTASDPALPGTPVRDEEPLLIGDEPPC
jgi:hypothetical protein